MISRLLQEKFRRDPLFFMKNVLGVELWEKQKEIVDAVWNHERVAVRSCHASGKTFVSAAIVLAFLFAFRPCKVITTSSQKDQVRYGLWKEIESLVKSARVPLFPSNKMFTMRIELEPDWFAIGIRPQEYNVEAFQGLHAPSVLIIFDEASGVPESFWDAAESLMTSYHARFLAIGNPFSKKSAFGACFDSPDWYCIKISAEDTPNVRAGRVIYPSLMSPDWPEKMKQKWGENSPQYYSRVLGEFPITDEEKLIPHSLAKSLFSRKFVMSGSPVTVIGLDPAGYGSSNNVWVVRRGLSILDIKVIKNLTDDDIANITHDLVRKWQSHQVVVNIDGLWGGKGISEKLVRRGIDVRLIFFSTPKENSIYANLKTECAFALKNAIEQGLTFHPAIRHYLNKWIKEVTLPVWHYDVNGKIHLQSKSTMKKELGHSPDLLDATLLTFAGFAEVFESSIRNQIVNIDFQINPNYDTSDRVMRFKSWSKPRKSLIFSLEEEL